MYIWRNFEISIPSHFSTSYSSSIRIVSWKAHLVYIVTLLETKTTVQKIVCHNAGTFLNQIVRHDSHDRGVGGFAITGKIDI